MSGRRRGASRHAALRVVADVDSVAASWVGAPGCDAAWTVGAVVFGQPSALPRSRSAGLVKCRWASADHGLLAELDRDDAGEDEQAA